MEILSMLAFRPFLCPTRISELLSGFRWDGGLSRTVDTSRILVATALAVPPRARYCASLALTNFCSWRYVVHYVPSCLVVSYVFYSVSSKAYYVIFAVCRPKSVCLSSGVCLSCVTLLRPTQVVELFGNMLHRPSNSLGTRTVCIKILKKNPKGFRWSCKLNGGSVENWRLDQHLALFRKRYKIRL